MPGSSTSTGRGPRSGPGGTSCLNLYIATPAPQSRGREDCGFLTIGAAPARCKKHDGWAAKNAVRGRIPLKRAPRGWVASRGRGRPRSGLGCSGEVDPNARPVGGAPNGMVRLRTRRGSGARPWLGCLSGAGRVVDTRRFLRSLRKKPRCLHAQAPRSGSCWLNELQHANAVTSTLGDTARDPDLQVSADTKAFAQKGWSCRPRSCTSGWTRLSSLREPQHPFHPGDWLRRPRTPPARVATSSASPRNAFRRPVVTAEIDDVMKVSTVGEHRLRDRRQARRRALLAAPSFIYRRGGEMEATGSAARLSSLRARQEVASC